MKFKMLDVPEQYKEGLEELLTVRGHSLMGRDEGCQPAEEIIGFSMKETKEAIIRGSFTGGREAGAQREAKLEGKEKVFLFRAFMRLVRELEKRGSSESFQWEEKILLERNGVMMDCSRNSVLTVDTIKKYIRMQAALGMNTMMLYTEDTYEVPEYPYFGYMRGRYTFQELKEMVNYAELFGIEMVPCIQTLAHLKNTLRWADMEALQDTDDILMVGNERVYDFIRSCISSAVAPFHTKRVHLGMDEAWSLGLGKYLHKNGYHSKAEVMSAHLERVVQICRELDLEPMIWSDMYLRMNSAHNEYYDVPLDTDLSGAVKPPKDVALVYWDYYHEDQKFYEEYLRMHKELSDKVIFAGGGWVWNGVSPNLELAIRTTDPAMRACKKAGIREAVCTMWQDNGAETPMAAGIPAIVWFAEHSFAEEVEEHAVRMQVEFLTGSSYDAFMLLGKFDSVPGFIAHSNPSKFLLYQDVMMGLFDAQIQDWEAGAYYQTLRDRLIALRGKAEGNSIDLLLGMYIALADVLMSKADLGKQLYRAYSRGEREILWRIAQKDIPECTKKLEQYRDAREQVWDAESKIFGFEVIDSRIGALLARMNTASRRVAAYVEGRLDSLPELEEKRLPFIPAEGDGSAILVSCNVWTNIVSASPM